MQTTTHRNNFERITVRRVRAAMMLGMSPRKLQTLTSKNKVPHIRLGNVILYSPDALRAWAIEQSGKVGV